MKLILDENLSDRITPRIIDLCPDSLHVKTLGLVTTDDGIIWDYAKLGVAELRDDGSRHRNILKLEVVN